MVTISTPELQTLTNTLRRIEVRFGQSGWHGDEAVSPDLYALYKDRPTHLKSMKLTIAQRVWEAGPPGMVLTSIAELMHKHTFLLGPFTEPDWYGMAIAMEAWMVTQVLDDPVKAEDEEFRRQLDEDSRARRLWTRPDRTTIRVVAGMSREGLSSTVLRRQDTDELILMDTAESYMEGDVLYGLRALMASVETLMV